MSAALRDLLIRNRDPDLLLQPVIVGALTSDGVSVRLEPVLPAVQDFNDIAAIVTQPSFLKGWVLQHGRDGDLDCTASQVSLMQTVCAVKGEDSLAFLYRSEEGYLLSAHTQLQPAVGIVEIGAQTKFGSKKKRLLIDDEELSRDTLLRHFRGERGLGRCHLAAPRVAIDILVLEACPLVPRGRRWVGRRRRSRGWRRWRRRRGVGGCTCEAFVSDQVSITLPVPLLPLLQMCW